MKSTEEKENLSSSMSATLKTDNLSIVGDLAEVGLDAVIDDGILRDIPIVGVIVGVGKVVGNISDVLFTRKLAAFLFQLKDVDAKTRSEAIEKWETDSKYRVHVGETLLNMIHRCDDTQKAKWLSQLFYELVLINNWPEVFMRAEKVLSSLSVTDMRAFLSMPKEKYNHLSLEDGEWFANSGLYRLVGEDTHVEGETLVLGEGYTYTITEVGIYIYKILSID